MTMLLSRYETAVLGRPAKPVSYPAHIAGGVAGGGDDDYDGDYDEDADYDGEYSQDYLLEWSVWGTSFGKPINDIFGWYSITMFLASLPLAEMLLQQVHTRPVAG